MVRSLLVTLLLTAGVFGAEPAPRCECGAKCGSKADPRDSLVRVRRGVAQGSGAVIYSADGRSVVLTAAHVLDHAAGDLTVRAGGTTYPAVLIASDRAADLAALLVYADLPALALASTEPQNGDSVSMVGMTSLYSKGTIARREVLNGVENYVYATSEDSDGGDSGAPVLFKGQVCGVHLGKIGVERSAAPRAAALTPVRTFLSGVFRREGAKIVPVEPPGAKPAAPAPAPAKPTNPPAPTALQPGDLVTVSGRVIRPAGNGTYRDVGPAPAGAVVPCPTGRCPLQR